MLGTYGFFGWILIGALAGILAKAIMPGPRSGRLHRTILLGIAGALSPASSATQWAGIRKVRPAASSPRRLERSSSCSSTGC
jgi:uncharacterized membrane protein YeaQ/YmgE (transglycosylase-associated protein family)